MRRPPAQPDSLHLTLYLEPGDTLALGRCRVRYAARGLPSKAIVLENEAPPALRVQWQDAQGHWHQHRPRLAGWLPGTAPMALPTGRGQVQHYLDYPLHYTTTIAR